MDSRISRWIIEFLLRSSVPESLLQKTLTTLPLSGADTRLKKTLLLRSLHTLLLKASLSETALDILELLENLDTNVPVSEPHCRAYCAVAVECTVKYLAAASAPDDPGGEYAGAVRRVWKGRVAALEARRSGLFTGELMRWRDDVEAAMKEARVCERLAGLNSRREAMCEVRVYLEEAWELMGPSFLESVAAAVTKGKGGGGSEFVSWSYGRDIDNGDHGNDGTDGDGDGACMDVAMHDENHGKEQLEERVDANEEVGWCDLPPQRDKVKCVSPIASQKSNPQLKHKQSVLRTCNRGVKIYSPEEVEEAKSWSKHDPMPSAQVKKVRESLKSSSLELQSLVKDPLPDALHTSEVVRSKLATRDTNIESPIENQNETVDVPNPNVCKTVVLYQHNDANPVKKSSSAHCSNVDQPKLLERNRTARTYEWNDSIDNSPQATQPRRRKRKWTSLEEETLRAGVKMFGEGNWATIRSFYSNIFESRSGVDLKDKWRNMIR